MDAPKYGKAPEIIAVIPLPAWDEFMHWLYLPIQIDRQNAVPQQLHALMPVVSAAVMEETSRGASWRYIYLTARRGFATPGNPLNRPGWHADGFGTEDVNYVWTDGGFPTLFALGDFGPISTDHIESARQFEQRISEVGGPTFMAYPDKTLLRLTPEVVHAAPEIPAPGGMRSFLKVSFSNARYNLAGNSHNHGLNYQWLMHDRDAVRNDPAWAGGDSYLGEDT